MIRMTYINLADIVFNESKFERPSSSQIKALADSIRVCWGADLPDPSLSR
ncbi:hypothetical protein ACL6C3_13835 [Capilliphycus salinus ALCB114379]